MIGNPEHRPYVGQRVLVGNSPPKLATVLRVAPRARLIVQHDGTDLPVKVILSQLHTSIIHMNLSNGFCR